MLITLFIMIATGGFATYSILNYKKNGHFIGRPSRTIFSVIVFALAVFSLIKGVPIYEMQRMIETSI